MSTKIKKGIEKWNKAKKIIPGGTQSISKRSEMFLPEQWPSYFKKAKGVDIWDIDDNHYVDMSCMGLGTSILGYADDDVNNAVKNIIDKGTLTTLNCTEEVDLSELLLKLHHWAKMVRYARTGGEAMAATIRVARAHAKKDKIAFCGYHGWHDWYLAANLADNKNLDGHLLPGLNPIGVPRCLKGTALPFNHNKIEELEKIIEKNDIGVIVVEPIRHHKPKNNFLQKVRKIADEINAVLIFDEITSGWRLNVGGVHQLYKVYPDIVVYGKGMSNGFPMAAIVGNDVMNTFQDTFVSSTYWTDRIGFTASLATIDKMIKKNVPSHICRIGNLISKNWSKLSIENNLKIETINEFPPLTLFNFDYENESQKIYTLFIQEMLKHNFLSSKCVYVSYSHTDEHLNKYFEKINDVFNMLSNAIEKDNVDKLLNGPVAFTSFKRLT